MVYSVNLFANNLSPWDWTLAVHPTAVSWGSCTVDPVPIVAGSTNAAAGRYEAAAGTWTGTTGVSIFQWPGYGVLAFLIDMPYVGDNSCKIGPYPANYFYSDEPGGTWSSAHYPTEHMVEQMADSGDSTTWVIGPDGITYNLWCTIDQGTQVNANFYMSPRDK